MHRARRDGGARRTIVRGNAALRWPEAAVKSGPDIAIEITTVQRNDGSGFKRAPDMTLSRCGDGARVTATVRGQQRSVGGRTVHCGVTASARGAPPAGTNAADGIRSGAYSLQIRMLDGIDSGNTGLMVLHMAPFAAGDAHFDYVGVYSSAQGRWKGELINQPYADDGPAAVVRRSRGRHRLSGSYNETALKAKPPHSPASAASASRRCCAGWLSVSDMPR